jgi:putative peptide zinc metalloprotease protein
VTAVTTRPLSVAGAPLMPAPVPPTRVFAAAAVPPTAEPPRIPALLPGVELLGEYEGSGYATPHFIARRPDQQVVQLSRLLHLVASRIDGRRTLMEIAQGVAEAIGRPVSSGNVEYLLDTKLVPLGLVTFGPEAGALGTADGAGTPVVPACGHRPVLSLSVRRPLMSEAAVNRCAAVLRWLFVPLVVIEMIHLLIAADWWLLTHASLSAAAAQLARQPSLMLAVLGLTIASMVFHELGHAAGCRYGGARPGIIGAGIYIIWPALYTNVTDAYRLNRVGRLRTDLGGIYFNVVFILGVVAAYLLTGWQPLVAVVFLGHLEIVQQLLPVVRLDGYFILGDMVGVPDLFAYMKPILVGLVPGRRTGARAMALTRRARAVVRIWVVVTFVLLAGSTVNLAVRAPHLAVVFVTSLRQHLQDLAAAIDLLDGPEILLTSFSLLVMLLPSIGTTVVAIRVLRALTGPTFLLWSSRQRARARHLTR